MTFDAGTTLADRMRAHAGDHQHLYGHLMRSMATDWEQHGPVRTICRGWEQAPERAVVQLRLLAGLFRIVLTGRAPRLERYYPCLGGTAPPAEAWGPTRTVLAAHVDELHEALEIAPQTNEVGRSSALVVGIFAALGVTGHTRVRLFEPGASAGLNLLVDRFRFTGDGWSYGPQASPVQLGEITGPVTPSPFDIVDRRGCDLSPVDLTSPDGRLRLRSFVWPFDVDRYERLAAALEIAVAAPPKVDRAGAGEWLESMLVAEPDAALTVVWHSISRMYWPADEVHRVEAAVEEAGARMPLAYLTMEYPPGPTARSAELTMRLWDDRGGAGEPVVLATVGDHGRPVALVRRST